MLLPSLEMPSQSLRAHQGQSLPTWGPQISIVFQEKSNVSRVDCSPRKCLQCWRIWVGRVPVSKQVEAAELIRPIKFEFGHGHKGGLNTVKVDLTCWLHKKRIHHRVNGHCSPAFALQPHTSAFPSYASMPPDLLSFGCQ